MAPRRRGCAAAAVVVVGMLLVLQCVGTVALAPLHGEPWEGGRRRKLAGESAALAEGGAVIVVFDHVAAQEVQVAIVQALHDRTADAAEPAFDAAVSVLFADMTGLACNLTATALQYIRAQAGVEFVEYDHPVVLADTQAYVCVLTYTLSLEAPCVCVCVCGMWCVCVCV